MATARRFMAGRMMVKSRSVGHKQRRAAPCRPSRGLFYDLLVGLRPGAGTTNPRLWLERDGEGLLNRRRRAKLLRDLQTEPRLEQGATCLAFVPQTDLALDGEALRGDLDDAREVPRDSQRTIGGPLRTGVRVLPAANLLPDRGARERLDRPDRVRLVPVVDGRCRECRIGCGLVGGSFTGKTLREDSRPMAANPAQFAALTRSRSPRRRSSRSSRRAGRRRRAWRG